MNNKYVQLMLLVLFLFTSSFSKILDTLIIEGLSINKPSVVLNNIPLRKGAPFSTIDIQKSIKSLYYLGFFKDIDFFVTQETDSSASLTLKQIAEEISIRKGWPVSDALIHENIILIKNLYAEEGYLLVDIECELIETKVPGNVIVKFKFKEGKKVRIKKITFRGNKTYSEKKLKRKFKTKQKRIFSSGEYKEELFTQHLDSLMLFYHNKGYLDAKVVKDSAWYHKNNRDIYIVIEIKEGKRYYVGDFYFTGNRILEKETLKSRIAMKKGKPFNKEKFDMTKMFISNAYREEGYLWVQIQEQNKFRGDTVDVTFEIVEGRPAIVRKIDIKGNTKTRDKVIRRELQIFPSQKYRQSRLERSLREIMVLQYFNNVTPDLRPNDDATIDLVFEVEEKDNIGQFSAGAQYSQLEKFGGNFEIAIPNFRGAGELLSAQVELSKYTKRFTLGFTEPWIFNSPTSYSVTASYYQSTYWRNYYQIYLSQGIRRRLKWPDDYFYASIGYHIGYQEDRSRNYSKALEEKGFYIDSAGYLSKVRFTIERDERDLRLFPTRGSLFSVTTWIAGLGGDYSFVKGITEYEIYFPLFWKFVMGSRFKFGLLDGFGKEKHIDIYDLFAAGGIYGVDGVIRGYSERTFGQQLGHGLSMLTFTGELRFPILEQQLYIAGFADIGNTWDDFNEIDLKDMFPGVGVGFRLNLPMVGLIGFDFAWGLKDVTHPHFGGKANGFMPAFTMQRGF
jgi:outer membrane protein insertion porin family